MADNEFSYLNAYLPQGNSVYKITKQSFGVLNEKNTSDGNCITKCENISMDGYPQIVPRKRWEFFNKNNSYYDDVRAFCGFSDRLFIIYSDGSKINLDIYKEKSLAVTLELQSTTDDLKRSIVLFNVANTNTESGTANIMEVTYTKKVLIFPDKKSFDFDTDFGALNSSQISEILKNITDMPDIKQAVVHNSRLFGISDDMVFASAYNDYSGWTLDTVGITDSEGNVTDTGYDENHAWCSTAQSNTRASGDFVGITTFDGYVVCFKKDYMQEVYGTYNPFRINDVYADGATDGRSIQVVGSKLIFASKDYIKVYTGSQPKIISYPLDISDIKEAVSGTDGRKYYVFLKYGTQYADSGDYKNKAFLVYDTLTESWVHYSESEGDILGFANNNDGMYAVRGGNIIKLECDGYSGVEWSFDTDFTVDGSIDMRHVHKLQILCEMGPKSEMSVYMLSRGAFDEENYGYKENTYKKTLLATAINEDTAVNYLKTIRIYPNKNTANYGFKLRFEGVGYVKLYNTEIFVRQGGTLNVGSPKSK